MPPSPLARAPGKSTVLNLPLRRTNPCCTPQESVCRALSGLIFRKHFSCLNCENAGEAGTVLQHQRGENRTSFPRIVVIEDMQSRSANWGSVLEHLDGV